MFTMGADVLVTGAAGFLGSHLVRALQTRGHRVRAMDLRKGRVGAEWLLGSITDGPLMEEACFGVDTVYHLAAETDLAAPHRMHDMINRFGSFVTLQAAKVTGVRRIVFASSHLTCLPASGPPDRHYREDAHVSPLQLIGAFARAKRRAELRMAVTRGVEPIIAIPTYVAGPDDQYGVSSNRFLADLATGRQRTPIDTYHNFVDVRSVAEGLIACAEYGEPGQRYMLAGEDMSTDAFLQLWGRVSGRPMPGRRVSTRVALAAAMAAAGLDGFERRRASMSPVSVRIAARRGRFASDKASRMLGWEPLPLATTLHDTWAWMQRAAVVPPTGETVIHAPPPSPPASAPRQPRRDGDGPRPFA